MKETYLCDRCEAQMFERNDVLYRTCKCKKSGYITASGVQKNIPLMPFHANTVQGDLCLGRHSIR